MMHRIRAEGFHFYEGGEKWLAKGVTYGPFRPHDLGHRYLEPEQVEADFAAIAATGANAVRLYDLPPESLVQAAARHGLRLLIDISWPKHLDVYDDPRLQETCLRMVEEGVRRIREWDNVLGVLLGNEIPADLVRWKGPRRVERLLRRMYDRARSLAPELLVGFANYPSTEYLRLDFFDFIGFNVYLNDPRQFRDYLIRLRHLYPEKPVLLSECGLDTKAATVEEQCELLPVYLISSFETGLAGAFVFSWTDEWHTGGEDVTEWHFGLVDHDRCPKPALEAVTSVFRTAPQCVPQEAKISVVVATYNGARTLRECLESLEALDYPHFEIIVVDDGSTDSTQEILKAFPSVRVITQPNRGLSAARNAGIEAATGEIVAFTDSDCVADRDWLYHIASFLQAHPEMAGVGGPNITPCEDRLEQKAVALAPGHATHVLLSQAEAEHVPGCNMAFRRDALIAVNGFDPVYRKAGDDVDVIWRLQDAGYKVGFSTAAFVWHHRRPTLRSYLKQQRGYGEAEALLLRRHPHRFNDRGQSIWRGVIYPSREMRPLFGGRSIQFGVFGTSGYQCIYERSPSAWWFYVTSLEWWGICLFLLLAGTFAPAALALGAGGIGLTVGVSALKALHGWPASSSYPRAAFPLVWLLWILHPIARGGARYWHRLAMPPVTAGGVPPAGRGPRRSFSRPALLEFWSQTPGLWRVDLLRRLEEVMQERQWIYSPNNIWQPWDLSVVVSVWFRVVIISAEECHGGPRRLLRMRFQLVPSSPLYLVTIGALLVTFLVALYDNIWARWTLTAFLLVFWALYRHASNRRQEIQAVAEELILAEGYVPAGQLARTRAPRQDDEMPDPAADRCSQAQQNKREFENA